MYCKDCGTEIVDGVCPACASAQEIAPVVEEKQPNPRMLGFGKALAGTIIGYVGLIYVAYVMAYGLIGLSAMIAIGTPAVLGLVGYAIAMIPALVMSILCIVYGIRSIKIFRQTKERKPIATLVLGINNLDFGVSIAMVLLLVAFMVVLFALTLLFA